MRGTAHRFAKFALTLLVLAPVVGNGSEESTAAKPAQRDEKRADKTIEIKERTDARVAMVQITPRGKPGSRTGGGTRGGGDLPTILALAPQDLPGVGLTARAQPTLSWYLSSAIDERIDFILIDEDSESPLLKVTIAAPISRGVHALRLSDYGLSLEAAKTYRWFVTLVPDPLRRSNDIISSAAIRWVEAPTAGVPPVASGGDRPAYAEVGGNLFWYDAFADLMDALAANPSDRGLRREQAALLEKVGFDTTGAN